MVKPTQVTNDIRTLRFARGEMTQAELAERIGVTRQTVIAIEQGRYSPVARDGLPDRAGVRRPARRRLPVPGLTRSTHPAPPARDQAGLAITPAQKGTPMNARTTGALYLVVAVCGGFAELAARSSIRASDDVADALRDSADLMKVAFAADLLAYACFLLVGIALYALFKGVHRTAAVAMLTMNAVSVAIQSLNLVNHAGAALAAQRGADELAVLFLDLHGVGYLIAQVFFGGWLLPLGYLVVRSGMVPRVFGYALMVGGVGYLLGLVVELVAPGGGAVILVPGMLGGISEVAFLLWLLVKGVREPVREEVAPTFAVAR